MLALPENGLETINIPIMPAVNTTAGVYPEVQKFRPRIEEELPKFNLKRFDNLARRAMALAYSHMAHLSATEPQDRLNPLFVESVSLCDLLRSDVSALITRGLVHPDAIANLKGTNGYKNTQSDLQILVNVFRANWANVANKCGTTEEELARGEKLVSWLIQAVGLKEQGPVERARTANMRMRAFTLFIQAYDDARRAIVYLLGSEKAADAVIPSLYAGRTGRKKANGEEIADAEAVNSVTDVATPLGNVQVPNGTLTSNTANGATNANGSSDTDGGPFTR